MAEDAVTNDTQGGTDDQPETMPSMEELLKQAELNAQEHHDAWLRARAEADNIRKRAQLDVGTPTSMRWRDLLASCWQ